ncbi:MAG: hypothetical protein VKJ31_03800 [Synechococcus sp.]|nr:hypothetical protein [Synechococcus sp.]
MTDRLGILWQKPGIAGGPVTVLHGGNISQIPCLAIGLGGVIDNNSQSALLSALLQLFALMVILKPFSFA